MLNKITVTPRLVFRPKAVRTTVQRIPSDLGRIVVESPELVPMVTLSNRDTYILNTEQLDVTITLMIMQNVTGFYDTNLMHNCPI